MFAALIGLALAAAGAYTQYRGEKKETQRKKKALKKHSDGTQAINADTAQRYGAEEMASQSAMSDFVQSLGDWEGATAASQDTQNRVAERVGDGEALSEKASQYYDSARAPGQAAEKAWVAGTTMDAAERQGRETKRQGMGEVMSRNPALQFNLWTNAWNQQRLDNVLAQRLGMVSNGAANQQLAGGVMQGAGNAFMQYGSRQ